MDPLRGFLSIMVIGFHVGNSFGVADEPTTLRHITGRLAVAVPLFFVVSGFLLYRPFVMARLQRRPPPLVRGYAWRRILRILPGYWVALTIFTVVVGVSGIFTLSNGPRIFLLIQNYWASTFGKGLGQAWSLSVEITFYAALGLFVFIMGQVARRRRISLAWELGVVIVVIACGPVFRWLTLRYGLARPGAYMPFYVDSFGAGMLLAVLSAHVDITGSNPWWTRLIERAPGISWAIALFAYWIVAFRVGLSGDYRQAVSRGQVQTEETLYTVIAVFAFLPAVWGERRPGARRLLDNAPLRFLGRISYGLFLYQGLVIYLLLRWGLREVAVPHLSYLIYLAATTAGSAVLGAMSWYLLEVHALKLKRLVPSSRSSQPTPGAAAADAAVAGAPW
jgi:peptidoglycan/LPS O-acetylase OafA/YrhL